MTTTAVAASRMFQLNQQHPCPSSQKKMVQWNPSRQVAFAVTLLLFVDSFHSCHAQQQQKLRRGLDEDENGIIGCPRVSSIDSSTELDINDPSVARAWNELSGLAASPTQLAPSGAPVMWGHNDGRDRGEFGTNFAAWDPITGERLITFQLPYDDDENSELPIVNQDWEDFTIGSCGASSDYYSPADTCLYLADLGDNRAGETKNDSTRPSNRPYRIYKVKEPKLSEFEAEQRSSLKMVTYPKHMVTAVEVDYMDASSPVQTANCEALFFDHTGWGEDGAIGDLYFVTKSREFGRLYKVPASAWPTGSARVAHFSPFVVGSNYGDGDFADFLWTSAEMSWDGTKIIMGNVWRNNVFLRCPGQSVQDAIVGVDACRVWENPKDASDSSNQFESVAFYPDDQTVLNIAESMNVIPHIVRVSLDYSNPDQYCPNVAFVETESGTVCSTIPMDGGTGGDTSVTQLNFVVEIKPDAWCEDYARYFGSAAPSSAPSMMPSNAPTGTPTLSNSPTMTVTDSPTVQSFTYPNLPTYGDAAESSSFYHGMTMMGLVVLVTSATLLLSL
eukprot:scaffold1301_cov128-Cylindrotheca_fusiformis.AAC.6